MKNILQYRRLWILSATLLLVLGSGCSSSAIKPIQEVDAFFKGADALAKSSQIQAALANLDSLIAQRGGEHIPGNNSQLTYGDIATLQKERLQCDARKQSHRRWTSAGLLQSDLKTALRTANETQLDQSLTCGMAKTTPEDNHVFLNDTQKLAQDLLALRKNAQGHLLPFKSQLIQNALLTEGYSDGKVRRFDLDFDDGRQEWIVDAMMEGTKTAVLAAPLSTAPEPQVAKLTPAQEQQMRADFAQYTDPNGLVSPDINPGINTTGNGLLYTSYYYMYLYAYGVFKDTDMQNFVATVQACRKNDINGLYNRTPTKTDQEGPDDYIGLAACSSQWTINAPISGDIYNYGENTYAGPFNWVFNNENPGQFSGSAWLGRLPQFVAHVQMATKRRPEDWRRLVWIASLEISKTSNPDGNQDIVLNWPMAATVAPRLPGMRLVARGWKKRVLNSFPQGMKQVFSVYLNNPNHPLSKWAVTSFPWK